MELHPFLPSGKSVLTVKKEDIDIQKNGVNDSKEEDEEEVTVNVDVDVESIVKPTKNQVQAQEVSLLPGASRGSDHVMCPMSIAELRLWCSI
jgi:hypothetical protein